MTPNADCIFCAVVQGEAPARVVHEDETTLAFLDINPIVDGHTLIVPRARDIGGFEVRRALPSAKRQMVGPFIFFDQMGPAEFLPTEGLDVRPHPAVSMVEEGVPDRRRGGPERCPAHAWRLPVMGRIATQAP